MHSRQGVVVPAQPKNTAGSALSYLAEQLAAALGPRPSSELKSQKHCGGGARACGRVPLEVWAAIECATPETYPVTRRELAERISPLMAIGDWRFCKCYRHGETAEHRFVYRLVDTVSANADADARESAYQGRVFVSGDSL